MIIFMWQIKQQFNRFQKNLKTNIKPLVVDDYIFVVTNNNLLVAWSLKNGKIIYSYNINEKIKNYLEIKKNKVKIKL